MSYKFNLHNNNENWILSYKWAVFLAQVFYYKINSSNILLNTYSVLSDKDTKFIICGLFVLGTYILLDYILIFIW